jgi:hypothetical protein
LPRGAGRKINKMGSVITKQNSGLNEAQEAFVANYVRLSDLPMAVAAAGVVLETGRRWLRQPEVLLAVHIEVAKRLQASAPIAVRVLEDIFTDTTVSARVRVDAAKAVLDRAGYAPPRAAPPVHGPQLTLTEMSLGELRALAATLEGELSSRAKDVTPAARHPVDALLD